MSDFSKIIIFASENQCIKMAYLRRLIDGYLSEWKNSSDHKPLLLRGARQVGKSSAVKHLGKAFKYYAEVNFEKQKSISSFFQGDIDVRLICSKISAVLQVPIIPGETLLFLDEIQECKEAIMALRFFREDYPELHVISAGSLLEFALEEIPTFGVGRIHSLFMYPLTFDEFLWATSNDGLMTLRDVADCDIPLDIALHDKLCDLLRIYMIVGGMPEAVVKWVETSDFSKCAAVHNDILLAYEDDFNKYNKRISPELLRSTMRSVCHQIGEKFSYSAVSRDIRSYQIQESLDLLTLAGLVTPVVCSAANALPLDAESNNKYHKYLFIDTGLLLSLLQLENEQGTELIELILSGSPQDVSNKGQITEMLVGLEFIRYKNPIQRYKLYYWQKNGTSIAEVDYVIAKNAKIIPVEVKSGTRGGMKSLWMFMREKSISEAYRISLENFGKLVYTDVSANGEERLLKIVPLYAVSKI